MESERPFHSLGARYRQDLSLCLQRKIIIDLSSQRKILKIFSLKITTVPGSLRDASSLYYSSSSKKT